MYKKSFDANGYFKVEDFIPKRKQDIINRDIISLANQFSRKINNKVFNKKIKTVENLNEFIIKLEKYNPKYLFHFSQLIARMQSMLNLINYIVQKKLLSVASNILCEKKNELLTSFPASFLINMPKNKRLLYHWHTARSGYPKREKYINFWVPILKDKKSTNGSLIVAKKSHHNDSYPYKEFRDTKRYGQDALTQMVVPKPYIDKFKTAILKCKVGSVYGMHRNLLHSSTINKSKSCSYVMIFKIWSISKDLTLNSNIGQKLSTFDSGFNEDVIAI